MSTQPQLRPLRSVQRYTPNAKIHRNILPVRWSAHPGKEQKCQNLRPVNPLHPKPRRTPARRRPGKSPSRSGSPRPRRAVGSTRPTDRHTGTTYVPTIRSSGHRSGKRITTATAGRSGADSTSPALYITAARPAEEEFEPGGVLDDRANPDPVCGVAETSGWVPPPLNSWAQGIGNDTR